MKIRFILQLMVFGLAGLVLVSVATAIAATNTVPPTRLDSQTRSITANSLKPAWCASLDLSSVIAGSGAITGTNGNDLILGSAGDDTINGLDGNDCIVAGDGADTINGGNGSDICNTGGDTGDGTTECETTLP